MLRAFKVFDVSLQTLLFGVLMLGVAIGFALSQQTFYTFYKGLVDSWFYLAGPIGIWHGISCLVHAFLPKTWQQMLHRRVYGWGVVSYFTLAVGLILLELQGVKGYRTQILILSLPIGLCYYWISWRELFALFKPHAAIQVG